MLLYAQDGLGRH